HPGDRTSTQRRRTSTRVAMGRSATTPRARHNDAVGSRFPTNPTTPTGNLGGPTTRRAGHRPAPESSEECMQLLHRGDVGPAVAEIRNTLAALGLLPANGH